MKTHIKQRTSRADHHPRSPLNPTDAADLSQIEDHFEDGAMLSPHEPEPVKESSRLESRDSHRGWKGIFTDGEPLTIKGVDFVVHGKGKRCLILRPVKSTTVSDSPNR